MGCSGSKPTTVATQPQGSVPSSFKKKERPPEVQAAMDRLQDEMADVKDRAIAWAAQNPDSCPDPTGEQLASLVPVLQLIVAHFYDDQNSAFGLGWDFMSLPQYGNTSETPLEKGHDGDDRTPEQLAQFALALGTINVWYGHPRTLTIVHNVAMPASALNQTEYGRRGWCIFELTISSIIKDNTCFIEVSKFGTSAVEDWGALILRCRARRPAPVAPDVFRTMMIEGTEREAAVPGSGIRFTSGKDLTEIVIPQYKEGFVRLFGQSLKLVYATLAWGDNEAAALSAALAYAGRVGALDKCESISLDGNMITDIGAGDLITMLRDKTVKTPRLQRFTCYGNRFSSVCKAQIKEAARERSIATVGV